jgi:hypothetical protein
MMIEAADDGELYELRLSGDLDRHAAEALRLEVRRLAKQHGLEVMVRVEKVLAEPPPEPKSDQDAPPSRRAPG